ncbi:hypothetical protein PGT21_002584 [Puccinia graminis f. sp. tritici]|uniref:Uncharacterized protein n=1 Tax=Puccinia graminis f. sp. tritici TaxID=56615 RepID=A0A5B0MMP0_PUCGR|nr:hypothetical protein PGT21_002584 [Puccinia graminis f. sp. tritici]
MESDWARSEASFIAQIRFLSDYREYMFNHGEHDFPSDQDLLNPLLGQKETGRATSIQGILAPRAGSTIIEHLEPISKRSTLENAGAEIVVDYAKPMSDVVPVPNLGPRDRHILLLEAPWIAAFNATTPDPQASYASIKTQEDSKVLKTGADAPSPPSCE